MKTMFAIATLLVAGLSLGGCMTDQQLAQATPQQKAQDCRNSKIAGVITGLPGGLIGAMAGYGMMTQNPSCKKTVLEQDSRPQPHGQAIAWRNPDDGR